MLPLPRWNPDAQADQRAYPGFSSPFFSEKDGEIHRWDMCEECYDNLLGQFRVEPDVEEQVEFI